MIRVVATQVKTLISPGQKDCGTHTLVQCCIGHLFVTWIKSPLASAGSRTPGGQVSVHVYPVYVVCFKWHNPIRQWAILRIVVCRIQVLVDDTGCLWINAKQNEDTIDCYVTELCMDALKVCAVRRPSTQHGVKGISMLTERRQKELNGIFKQTNKLKEKKSLLS